MDCVFPDPVIERLQAWRFEHASETAPASREAELLRALVEAAPHEVEKLVDELRRIRPHLTSGGRTFIPFARAHWSTKWIYVDEWLITDRLPTTHSTTRRFADSWVIRPWEACIVGSIDRKQGDYLNLLPSPR